MAACVAVSNPFELLEVEETEKKVRVLDLSGGGGARVEVRSVAAAAQGTAAAGKELGGGGAEEEGGELPQLEDTPGLPIRQGVQSRPGRVVHCTPRATRDLLDMIDDNRIDAANALSELRYMDLGQLHRANGRNWKMDTKPPDVHPIKMEQRKGTGSFVILALVKGAATGDGRAVIVTVFQRRHTGGTKYKCHSNHFALLKDSADLQDHFDDLMEKCSGSQ